MEAVTACCDHNNKENIPPFFSAIANKSTNPVPQTGSYSKKKCKKLRSRRRKPLADITNLHLWQYQFNSASSLVPITPATPTSSASNPRKRKAIQEVNSTTIQVTSSKYKSLRMGFRWLIIFLQLHFNFFILFLWHLGWFSSSIIICSQFQLFSILKMPQNSYNK